MSKNNSMLTSTVYPIVSLIVWIAFLVFLSFLILRLIFNYADPNPFGAVGRFGFRVRKASERFVYPASRFLATYRVDTRLAPIVTALIALFLTYFGWRIIGNTFEIIDGLSDSVGAGNPKKFIGFVLYGLLSVLVLFIFIRFLSSWFVFTRNTFLGFVKKVTDPIMLPVQRLVPPMGMFDLSGMLVLIFIWLLQSIVMATLIKS